MQKALFTLPDIKFSQKWYVTGNDPCYDAISPNIVPTPYAENIDAFSK